MFFDIHLQFIWGGALESEKELCEKIFWLVQRQQGIIGVHMMEIS